MKSAFADIFGAPGTPGFYVRAQHAPQKMKFILFFSYFLF